MIFGFIVISVFVAASIYFFFRAEALQRELITAKRDANNANKENKVLVASMVKVASRFEEFAKKRHAQIKLALEAQEKNEAALSTLQSIMPLVQNYSAIYCDCSKGSGRLQAVTKKCYENYQKNSFKEFTTFINKQDKGIKKYWASNNLSGFISLVEALLVQQEENVRPAITAQGNKAVNE